MATNTGPSPKGIVGVDVITTADLDTLVSAIDSERLRLENLRVSAMREKIQELVYLSNTISDYAGKVKREEMTIEEVPIYPAKARLFLKTLGTAASVQPLLEEEFAPPHTSAPTATAIPAIPTGFQHALLQFLQQLRWSVEAQSLTEKAVDASVQDRLGAMERRITTYATSETPMPEEYAKSFLSEIAELRKRVGR